MRLTSEELQKVKDKYGVDELYSWSKVNCFMTSHYEFYLKYILHKKEDIDNCAYAPLGSCVHQIIEDYYSGKTNYSDMINNFEDSLVTMIDIADLKFDRSDEEKNENIKNKYKLNLYHFFENHKPIKRKVELERFLAAKIGDYVLQGYADAITKDEDGNFVIIDWKTSTKYTGDKLEKNSGQLTVYAIALTQLGIPLEKIRCCFNFLKYCNVETSMKNGKKKVRTIERYKLGESLTTNAKMWLKDYGCNEEEVDDYLKRMIDTNDIKCLPQEVQNKFVIEDCYGYIDLNEKLVDKWTKEIITTIKDINFRLKDYKETNSDRIWWDNEESVKAQSYYFATLSGYSANLNKPYAEYLKKLEAAQNGTDLFSGLGLSSESSSKITIDKDGEADLSWLDSLF